MGEYYSSSDCEAPKMLSYTITTLYIFFLSLFVLSQLPTPVTTILFQMKIQKNYEEKEEVKFDDFFFTTKIKKAI
jgi:hypothetical protein